MSVIEVLVTDKSSGRPLVGADVGVFLVEQLPAGREPEAGWELHRGVTDPRGLCAIQADVPASTKRRVLTFVRCRGHAEWRAPMSRGRGSQAQPDVAEPTLAAGETLRIEASLERGTTLRGRVVDCSGSPVPDAHIGLVLSRPTSCSWPYAIGIARDAHWPPPVRTDPHGEFEWLSFPLPAVWTDPTAQYVLLATHEAHAPAMLHRVESLPPTEEGVIEHSLRLQPGTTVSGRVLDANGLPLPGATVTATAAPVADQPVCVRHEQHATADGDGHIQLRGLPQVVHTLTAQAPGHAPWSGGFDPVAQPGTLPDIRLATGTDLSGRVLDRAGAPIAGVRIWASMQEPRAVRTAESDAQGEFRLEGLPAQGRVEVRCSLYVVLEVDLPSPPITLRSPPRADLRARLLDAETGSPLVGTGYVTAFGPGFSCLLEPGPEGTLQRLETPVGSYELWAEVPGRATASSRIVLPEEGLLEPVVIRVPAGLAVEGRVVDTRGHPLAGIDVAAFMPHAHLPRQTTTDAAGQYQLRGLSTRARLIFTGAGLAPSAVRLVHDGPTSSVAVPDVTLGVGATVTGRVTRSDGGPVARTNVQVAHAGWGPVPFAVPSTLCDEAGRFALHHVPEGDLVLTAGAAQSTIRSTHGSAHEVTLTLV